MVRARLEHNGPGRIHSVAVDELSDPQAVSLRGAEAEMAVADFRTNTVEESGLGHDSPPCESSCLAVGTAMVPKTD